MARRHLEQKKLSLRAALPLGGEAIPGVIVGGDCFGRTGRALAMTSLLVAGPPKYPVIASRPAFGP
jgi:hypothetical protein